RLLRVAPELAQGAPLAQEIPALIQLDAQRVEPGLRRAARDAPRTQGVLFLNELLDPVEYPLIFSTLRHTPSFLTRVRACCGPVRIPGHHRTLGASETLRRLRLEAVVGSDEDRACAAGVSGLTWRSPRLSNPQCLAPR